MFGTIRKHQTWLWVVIIALMSVSLLVFFTADGTLGGGGGPQTDLGSFYGRPIGTAEFLDAQKEMRLASFMRTGRWPDNNEEAQRAMERETISRVFLLHKAKELDIHPSQKAVALMTQEMIGDYPYPRLIEEVLAPNGLKQEDFERYVRHEAAIRQLVNIAAVSAKLVNPAEAEILFRKENQEANAQVALFWASNAMDQVAVTNGAVEKFYTNRMALYFTQAKLTVSYVDFAATNYFTEADKDLSARTNLTALLDEAYRRMGGTNFYKDTNGVPTPEADAKSRIQAEFRLDLARRAARRAASDFGNELYSQKDANKTETFEKLAAAKGLPVQVSAPFGSEADLEKTAFPDDFFRKAMSLTDAQPVHFNPIIGDSNVFLIARKASVPRRLQPLDEVRDKVTGDYKHQMALEMMRKAGPSFHTNLTNGLALKKSFQELADTEKVTVLNLPPISPSMQTLTNLDPRLELRLVQSLAASLEPGKASPFIPLQEGGMILYVKDRPVVSDAKVAAELPEFIGRLRQYRQREAFETWFRKQAELAKLSGPKRETTITGQPN
jgi:hypothetical protein